MIFKNDTPVTDKQPTVELLVLVELGIHCPHCRRRQVREDSIQPITLTSPKEEHPNWTPDAKGILSCEYCDRKFLITIPLAIEGLFSQKNDREGI